MKYSKERIFQSCNLHNHCLGTYLNHPILYNKELVDRIFILKILVTEREERNILQNIAHSVNTFDGEITAKIFFDKESPFDYKIIKLPLDNIYKIDSVELR